MVTPSVRHTWVAWEKEQEDDRRKAESSLPAPLSDVKPTPKNEFDLARDLVLFLVQHGVTGSFDKAGNLRLLAPEGKRGILTPEIKREARRHYQELVCYFREYPECEWPLGWTTRPCARCGEVTPPKKTRQGTWIDRCYWDFDYSIGSRAIPLSNKED